MFAIAPTNIDWFNYLKKSQLNSEINFWTPTQWNPRSFKTGDRLYFMLTKPIRKIAGFGQFIEYENLTLPKAWNKFGHRNGCNSLQELKTTIQKYIDKNSMTYGGKPIKIDSYKIGCITLNNCEFWDGDNYIKAEDKEIDFAGNLTKYKYYTQNDPFIQVTAHNDDFQLLNGNRDRKRSEVNIREGQSAFKGKILRAYGNKCCISEEVIPELLDAAHIQEYRNINSHHIQNGLLMRVDIHKLYDNGLIFIDGNYKIHVSSLIKETCYYRYHGKQIILPKSSNEHPLPAALELRRSEFRK